ncbi:MAG: polymerase [Variovorax sp.]|nr:MAG: polymerase [Variovorax sp.]
MTGTVAVESFAGSFRSGQAGLIALPFLFPLVAGPSANTWQFLATWSCAALLWLFTRRGLPSRSAWAWLAILGGAIALHPSKDTAQWLTACAALAVTAMAACIGAGTATRPIRLPHSALAFGLLAAALVSAVLGLLQYYGLAEPLVPWTTAPERGQAYGNLRQRNQFATLMSMALVAALWLYGAADSARARAGLAAAALLLLLGAAASTSRTGLLQWLSIVGVAAFMARRERRGAPDGRRVGTASDDLQAPPQRFRLPPPLALLALIPLYFAAGWLLPQLTGGAAVEGMLQRLREGAPMGHSRMILWRNVLTLIGERPWTGWGWGELSFAHYITLYPGPRFVEILDNAHNLPLHLAVELGVPAALLICGGFAGLVLAARPWAERDPQRLMVWGVLGVIVLHSLLEYPLWYGPFQLVFGLCLGVLWPGRRVKSSAPRAMKAVASAGSAVAAAALLALVGYAAWDYTRVSQLFLARHERLPAYRDDTLARVQDSRLFAGHVRFAELMLTPITAANAPRVHALAERVLHFSPEPRVIEKLIESATLLGRDDEAAAHALRFRIAFPQEYGRWLKGSSTDGSRSH